MALKPLILLSIFISYFLSCSSQKANKKNCGLAIARTRMYSKTKNTYVIPDYFRDAKKWFRDSIVIIEGDSISIKTDVFGNETFQVLINRYVYIDLKKKIFYKYNTFTDTARIIKKYSLYDSGYIDDKWNLFDSTSEFTSQKYFQIPDTVINRIIYSRYRVNSDRKSGSGESYKNIETLYLRCDIKNFQLSYNKPLSFKTGCFVTRIENFQPELNTCIYYEINMIRETLTKEEHKIFDAWEKNARENPVSK